jgi:hypothetical protein
MTVNNKEENSEDFCLDFVQEFSLCIHVLCTFSTVRGKIMIISSLFQYRKDIEEGRGQGGWARADFSLAWLEAA